MRKTHLLTATALSLILGALAAGQAYAATTISTATTTPVKTSGGTGDITVDAAGSITLTSGTAITVDSDNKVTLNGKIDMSKSADGSTGILITDVPGRVASGITVAANISVTDDFTATDTANSDGILEAPYTDGKTRYGIHSTGASPYHGDVNITSASTITVEGDNSYGVRFENQLDGAMTMDGSLVVSGNNDAGLALDKGATGNVYLSGSATIFGQNSSAFRLGGDYSGNIVLDGTYQGTGYATISSLTSDALAKVLVTPADLLQTGPLVDISGSVSHGVILDAIPTVDSTNASLDQDGDGISDAIQSTASLTNYGSAPALRIASATGDIDIGPEVYASTAVNPPAIAYGLDIRGSVTGSGVYQNVNPTAVQLGGLGHDVVIENGIRVKGTIQGVAYGGTGTGLSMQSGAKTPQLDISGTINATATSAVTPTTSGTTTTYSTVDASAHALDIANGAKLPIINIAAGTGGIYAVATGKNATAVAIRDQSDSLTTINNNNVISASISADDENGDGIADTVANHGVAIDTHTNTVGLTLTQIDTAPTDSTADAAIPAPFIAGDILLGSGDDHISSSGGSILGDIDFGPGANSFSLSNGATYAGKLTSAGTVDFDIAKGTVGLLAGTSLNLTNFHEGASSSLTMALDTAHPTVAPLNASGNAVFDDGAVLQLTLNNIVTTTHTFNVLTASNITLGNMSTSLEGKVPYIYHADLALNSAKTELDATFRLKTQSEGAFSNNEYAAFVPVLTAVTSDPSGETALIAAIDKNGFDKIYNQYLPDYSGENLIGLSLGAESLNKSLSALTLIPDNDGGQYWLQEYGYHTERERGETAGFKSTGFSFAGGRETKMSDNNMLGVYMSYTSGSPLDSFAIAAEDNVNSDLTVGGYWRVRAGAFKAWAHAGAGLAQFKTTRQVLSPVVNHIATAKWNGVSYSAGAGASVDYKAGWIGVTPQLFADLYGLNEDKHQETSAASDTAAGTAFDLDIGERKGHVMSTTALLNFNYAKSFVKPELWVGYRQNLSGKIPDTVAAFKNGTPFTLTGGDIKGGGPIAGFRLSADNQWSYFSLEGDYEKQDAYTNYSLSLRTRFQF